MNVPLIISLSQPIFFLILSINLQYDYKNEHTAKYYSWSEQLGSS